MLPVTLHSQLEATRYPSIEHDLQQSSNANPAAWKDRAGPGIQFSSVPAKVPIDQINTTHQHVATQAFLRNEHTLRKGKCPHTLPALKYACIAGRRMRTPLCQLRWARGKERRKKAAVERDVGVRMDCANVPLLWSMPNLFPLWKATGIWLKKLVLGCIFTWLPAARLTAT